MPFARLDAGSATWRWRPPVPRSSLGRLLLLGIEVRVGLRGSGREMAGVRVQVAARRLDGLVSEDALEDMQRDPSVGHPRRAGVSEPVPGERGKSEPGNEFVPLRPRRSQEACRRTAVAQPDRQSGIDRRPPRLPDSDESPPALRLLAE